MFSATRSLEIFPKSFYNNNLKPVMARVHQKVVHT